MITAWCTVGKHASGLQTIPVIDFVCMLAKPSLTVIWNQNGNKSEYIYIAHIEYST